MFQSTRPTGGATRRWPRLRAPPPFQSTRPTRGATVSGYLTDMPTHPRSPARTCRRRRPILHTYHRAPPPTHSPHWRYLLPRTPALSHVRFTFALLTPSTAPAGRTTPSPPHAPL